MTRRTIFMILAVFLVAGLLLSGALPVAGSPCANFYPATGHCYTPVLVPSGITWDEANAAAQAAGGYLATSTSAGENDYVFGLVSGNSAYWYLGGFGPWLGGYQQSCTPEPSCGWAWVSGEAWSYINWAGGQPDNWQGENKLHFFGGSGGSPEPAWNDWDGVSTAYGYVIEFDDSACTHAPSDLVSWWGGDGDAVDMAGNADGTAMNGATYAPGMVGEAFDLRGNGDYVQMAGAATGDLGSSPFTVDFWLLFPPTTGPDSYILGKSHPDGGQGWDIRLRNQNIASNKIVVSGVDGWNFNILSADLVTPNAWHHVALVGATTAVTLYIDGQPQGSSGRQTISTASNPFRVGMTTNYGGNDFNGLVDELEIFGRALSQAEVQAIYNAGSAGKCRSYTLDHFLCYKIKTTKGEAKFQKIPGLDLGDSFEAGKFDVVKPLALCNPADKNGEGVSDYDIHLEDYQIKLAKTDPAQPKFVKRMNIQVTNQLGALVVDSVKPYSLLVPTAKNLQGPVDPPNPHEHGLDHFKCYKVKPRKNVCWGDPTVRCKSDGDCVQASPCVGKFPKNLQVTVEDQFTAPPRLYRVAKPAKLCLPVDKNNEGIKSPGDRIMCYQVKPVKKTCQAGSPQNALGACKREADCGGVRDQTAFCGKQPKREKVLRVHTSNQFGPEIMDAVKELQLCVPSTVTLPAED